MKVQELIHKIYAANLKRKGVCSHWKGNGWIHSWLTHSNSIKLVGSQNNLKLTKVKYNLLWLQQLEPVDWYSNQPRKCINQPSCFHNDLHTVQAPWVPLVNVWHSPDIHMGNQPPFFQNLQYSNQIVPKSPAWRSKCKKNCLIKNKIMHLTKVRLC